MATKKNAAKKGKAPEQKRVYIKQVDVPLMSLDEALRIPMAILENYAGKPTSPLYIGKALSLDPKGSQLRFLTGAAIAYGLVEGGAQASAITITELSKRILRPKQEGTDLAARREAILKPRIFKTFLSHYNGNIFPRPDIAINVLEDLGVPRDKTEEVLQRIESSAQSVGFIETINGKKYVTLDNTNAFYTGDEPNDIDENTEDKSTHFVENRDNIESDVKVKNAVLFPPSVEVATAIVDDARRKRVFITHGKNKDLVDPIKRLLEYGELVPVVSVERQSVSKPVPEKVMDDMRTCGAAIIHVDAEKTIMDVNDQEHVIINSNVLIEIGAAMAFYGKRFILLVKDGIKLPSNLQGLYEVRYSNDTLDAVATISLLNAIKDIKNYALPTDKKDD